MNCKICDGNGEIKGEKCIVCDGVVKKPTTSKKSSAWRRIELARDMYFDYYAQPRGFPIMIPIINNLKTPDPKSLGQKKINE